jgi:hypothetical protein
MQGEPKTPLTYEEQLFSEINEIRILAFIESAPQSNKYHQIEMTKDEYKRFADSVSVPCGCEKHGGECYKVIAGDVAYELPDLRSTVDEHEEE